MKMDVIQLPIIGRSAHLQSIDEEDRSFEVVWTTGARTVRYSWARDEAFDEELVVDERAVRVDRLQRGAPFLNQHRSYSLESVLGVVVEGSVRMENGQGRARVRLSERASVDPIWQDIKGGIIRNVSVGYRVHRYERIPKADRTDGGTRALYRAVDWEPHEISAVAIGADPEAQVRAAASGENAENECIVVRRDASYAAAAAQPEGGAMSGQTQAAAGENAGQRSEEGAGAQTGQRAETGQRSQEGAGGETGQRETGQAAPAPRAEPDLAGVRSAERDRVTTIFQLARRHKLGDQFAADLVSRDVSLDAARAAVLDALERDDPAGRSTEPVPAQARGDGSQERAFGDAMVNALLHRHMPGQFALEDGAREFRGMTLLELARANLERHGTSTRGMSKMDLAGSAFQMRAGGMHSTSDFPAILANVANKTLRQAYAGTPRTFQAWARRATITDFKPVQRTQLGGAPDLTKVLESGEFAYGTIGEGKEVYSLATYGRIVGITRQTLINDDLDAFTRVPAAFGASAADLESDIVYSVLVDNPVMADGTALFHANHGNLGTAGAISETTLSEAWRAFGQQKGLEGRLLSIMPRFVIVPPGSRFVEARKQITATTPASTSDVNPYAGTLEPVQEARLIPAAGADPWFLAADPSRIDTVEFAYLDGQEGVFTETRMGFEVDGMEIKARHDFAAKAIDHRGLFKNAGA